MSGLLGGGGVLLKGENCAGFNVWGGRGEAVGV